MDFSVPVQSDFDYKGIPIAQVTYFLKTKNPLLFKVLQRKVESEKPDDYTLAQLEGCKLSDLFLYVKSDIAKTLPTIGSLAVHSLVVNAVDVVPVPAGLMLKFDPKDEALLCKMCEGIPCPNREEVAKISEVAHLNLRPVPPVCVKTAHMITDVCKIEKSDWVAKTYERDYCSLANIYGERSCLVKDLVMRHFTSKKDNIDKKGVDLVDFMLPQLLEAFSKNNAGFMAFVEELKRLFDYEKIPKTPIRYRPKLGDFERGTIDYSNSLMCKCRASRGADHKDSTALNYAFYLPYNLPRNFIKALVFARDIVNISTLTGLKSVVLAGSKSKDSFSRLLLTGIKLDYVYTDVSLACTWEALPDQNGYFRHAGVNFIVCIFPGLAQNAFTVNCGDAKAWTRSVQKVPDNYFYSTVFEDKKGLDWGHFVPSVAPHNMSGFFTASKINDHKIALLDWLKMVDYANIARTFATYVPGRFYTYVANHFKSEVYNTFFFISNRQIRAAVVALPQTALITEEYETDLSSLFDAFTAVDPTMFAEAEKLNKANNKKEAQNKKDKVDDADVQSDDEASADVEDEYGADGPVGQVKEEKKLKKKDTDPLGFSANDASFF